MTYQGKVRLFVQKHEQSRQGYVLSMDYEAFTDSLKSNNGTSNPPSWLEDEIQMVGLELFDDAINDVLNQCLDPDRVIPTYADGDIVEILADAHLQVEESGWETVEYETVGWFENVKHRGLTNEEALCFCEDLAEEGANDASNV